MASFFYNFKNSVGLGTKQPVAVHNIPSSYYITDSDLVYKDKDGKTFSIDQAKTSKKFTTSTNTFMSNDHDIVANKHIGFFVGDNDEYKKKILFMVFANTKSRVPVIKPCVLIKDSHLPYCPKNYANCYITERWSKQGIDRLMILDDDKLFSPIAEQSVFAVTKTVNNIILFDSIDEADEYIKLQISNTYKELSTKYNTLIEENKVEYYRFSRYYRELLTFMNNTVMPKHIYNVLADTAQDYKTRINNTMHNINKLTSQKEKELLKYSH